MERAGWLATSPGLSFRPARSTLLAAALALAACRPVRPPDWGAITRETVATLDRAYTGWYRAEAASATTRAHLDRLVTIDATWERWLGRVVRVLVVAENADPMAARAAIDHEVEQARRWLVEIGALGPKGGR